MKRLGLLLATAAACLLTDCASSDSGATIAGTGSQTGNTVIAGIVLDTNARPLAGAHVSLRPLGWTDSTTAWAPNCVRDTLTDSLGRYRFLEIAQGTYRVTAKAEGRASILGIHARGDSIESANTALATTATLKGEIDLDDTTRGGRIEIYGVSRAFNLPDTGMEAHYVLENLPAGNLTLRIWSRRLHRTVLEMPVTLLPGKTTELNDEQWSRNPSGPEDIY